MREALGFRDDSASLHPTVSDALYAAVAPGAFRLAWLAARIAGASRDELRARTGVVSTIQGPTLWFHGASAGEMAAATALRTVLRQQGYRFTAIFTATNRQGLEFVSRSAGSDAVAALAPWDHPRWVARTFDQWRPAALFLVETELWPRMIFEAYRRNIPVFSVSARIYPRDVARYRLVRRFMAPTVRRLTTVLAQNETERQRFIALGAAPERCFACGNLKYVTIDDATVAGVRLRQELHLTEETRVIVCGSIHADEIAPVFAALERLDMDDLRVIIAPRHNDARAAIAQAAQRRNWHVHRRSDGPPPGDWRILLLDNMGELRTAYAIASVAVVGGGFGKHGGHNPLEPIMMDTPVLFGPHLDNFEEEARALRTLTPEAQVADAAQLAARLAEWLADGTRRQDMLNRQRPALPDGAAIAERYMIALSPWLGGRCG